MLQPLNSKPHPLFCFVLFFFSFPFSLTSCQIQGWYLVLFLSVLNDKPAQRLWSELQLWVWALGCVERAGLCKYTQQQTWRRAQLVSLDSPTCHTEKPALVSSERAVWLPRLWDCPAALAQLRVPAKSVQIHPFSISALFPVSRT